MSSIHMGEVIDLDILYSGLCAARVFAWTEAADHKPGLIEAIEAKRRSGGGMTRSNIGGGWHSDVDLPNWEHPSVAALMRFVADCADQAVAETNDVDVGWRREPWIVQGWANVNPPGGAANALHEHIQMNWHWAACYYVQCDRIGSDTPPDDAELGRLVFENRWHGLHLKDSGTRRGNRHFHTPREGELVFFPAWQHHRVEPHHQQSDRITIACNLHSRELERSRYWTYRPGRLPRQLPSVHDLLNRLRGGKAHNADGTPPGALIG